MAASLSVKEVADLLGRSVSWFYLHRDELTEVGFPEPMPIVKKWDEASVRAWMQGSCSKDSDPVASSRRMLDTLFDNAV